LNLQKLELEGAWKATLETHSDERGSFREWFKDSAFLKITGRNFSVSQANFSISKKDVLRGIHFSVAEEGQGKWVTCLTGSIWDVIVDLRQDSSTFKRWTGINLISEVPTCIFIPEGFGHGFVALEDNTTVAYLLTSEYSPTKEFEINPFDPELGISWHSKNLILSHKDRSAPNLRNSKVILG